MTVPSREEAARLLLSLDPPEWQLRHSRAVAEIAAWLALRVARSGGASRGFPDRRRQREPDGTRVDRRLVEVAALLHDVDKTLGGRGRGVAGHGTERPHGSNGLRGSDDRHGEVGARWLAKQGHPELGPAVRLHPVTLLVDPAGARRLAASSIETRLVAYADKRAGQRLEPMAERFARWRRRHPHSGSDGWSQEAFGAAWKHATVLEREVCALAGCRPQDVGRLRWTRRALETVRR